MEFASIASKMSKYTEDIVVSELTRARDQKVTEISFSRKYIKALPTPLIGQLVHLRRLILHENRLSVLPDEFSLLARLKYLELNKNHFQIFPEVLGTKFSIGLVILDFH